MNQNALSNICRFLLPPSTTLLVFFSLFACNNAPDAVAGATGTDTTGTDTAKGGQRLQASAGVLNDTLYTLYLLNTTQNSELFQLLGDPSKQQKLTLQFVRDKSDSLTLVAYASKNKNEDYQLSNRVLLHVSDIKNEVLAGKQVVLGDLQLAGSTVPKLRTIAVAPTGTNDPTNAYIWFVPKVSKDTDTGLSYVSYEIYSQPDAPKTTAALTPLGVINPSPPATFE